MEDSDVNKLLDADVDDDWVDHQSKRMSENIESKSTTLLQLVENLGPVLTHNKPQIRCHGLNLLTSTLEKLHQSFLNTEEVSLLVNFYTDRLRDHHSTAPSTLRGLFYLSRCDALNKEMLDTLLDRMFRELVVQQQVVRDRAVVFNMLSYLLFNRSDLVSHMETQFLVGFLQAGEGEKDPRNLSTIFQCTSHILQIFNVDHLREDIFESLAVYFPIDFTPPKGMSATVSKTDLINGLRAGISDPCLAEFSIPLFMEKLESDLESAKEDSVESLQELVRRSSKTQGSKKAWLAQNGKLLELVWKGLKAELLGIRLRASETVASKILSLITQISDFLPSTIGGLTSPEDDDSWRLWLRLVMSDVRPHLETAGTKLNQTCLHILAAVAGSGKLQSEAVMQESLPVLLTTWSKSAATAKQQLLVSVTKLLTAAAHTGMVCDESNEEFDKLFTIYLESGELDGLASAAGILNDRHRNELCSHLLSEVKKERPVGPAVLLLVSWDEKLGESILIPALLNLGDLGLNVLGHLLVEQFAAKFLLPVSQQISENKYSQSAAATFFHKLSHLHSSNNPSGELSNQVGTILTNLLSWQNRPTVASSDDEEKTTFCSCLQTLATLIHTPQVVEQVELVTKLQNQSLSTGEILEVEALVSSLSGQCLNNLQSLIKQVFSLSGMWRTKASIVNKLPESCDLLNSSNLQDLDMEEEVEAVGQIAHALALRGDSRAKDWLIRLVNLLQHQEKGKAATGPFQYLCSPATWPHAVTSLLFRQRIWSQLRPVLLEQASKPENTNHLAALLAILPQIPRPLLEPELSSLLPLLVRGLKDVDTSDPALVSLHLLLDSAPQLLASHTREIVERCLLLTDKKQPLKLRLKAIVCLNKISLISSPDIVALASSVTQGLAPALQDHKRVVREAAAKARNRWYLVA